MVKAGIIGGAGYTAGELLRLLINHPEVEIGFVNSTSNATKGSIILDDKVDLWPNIPDFSVSAMEVMEFNSDLDLSGTALFHSIFHLDPTIHIGQAGGFLGNIAAVSTEGMLIAHDDATTASTNLPLPLLFWADHIIETTVAIAAPISWIPAARQAPAAAAASRRHRERQDQADGFQRGLGTARTDHPPSPGCHA